MDIEDETNRIYGYAAGDRVAVVGGKCTGYIGKVVKVWDGCNPSCRDKCGLVRVALTHRGLLAISADELPPAFMWPDEPANERTLRVPDITHID